MGNIHIGPFPLEIVKVNTHPREMVAVAALAILIISVILIYISPGTDEMVEPDMEIEVVSTYLHEGSFEGTNPVHGKEWQMVVVNITNNNEKNRIEISVAHFYSIDSNGERIWVFNSEDYDHDPVEPGDTGSVLLVFMIDEGNTLELLEYTRSVSGPVQCSIPDVSA